MRFLKTFTLLFIFSAPIIAAADPSTKGIETHDAWAREAPPNAEVMAAYFTLHNHSAKTHTLISASSPEFVQVKMHRTEQHDGMTKMLPVSRVMLSTNGSMSFQPGGMHLMLMKPKKRFKSGDSISLTLFFIDESSMTISVPVKKGSGNGGHDMHHDHDESSHHEQLKPSNKNHHNSHSH